MSKPPEARDISLIPTIEIRAEISKITMGLKIKKLLPNGLGQLIVGSVDYRRRSLFFDSRANQNHFFGDPALEPLWQEWIKQYNGYSGDNLAATALYQHNRYDPTNEQFPKPETPEFAKLIKRMGGLGKFIKEFEHRKGWQVTIETLYEIEREISNKDK
jgi:hypothetical protein